MDAHTRLLDLLAGWSHYPYDDRPIYDDRAIYDAYQNAGQRENMSDDEIKAFVSEYVIPILLKGRL